MVLGSILNNSLCQKGYICYKEKFLKLLHITFTFLISP